MLSQHSVISIGIVTNITRIIILVIVLLTVAAIHMVRGGAEVDMTARTEVTAVVTGCTTVMGQDAMGEMKGGDKSECNLG